MIIQRKAIEYCIVVVVVVVVVEYYISRLLQSLMTALVPISRNAKYPDNLNVNHRHDHHHRRIRYFVADLVGFLT